MLEEQPADLVVTDLEMPNVDGYLLIKSIRAHPHLANIPILIVSSHASDEDHQLGLEAGADGYIVKTAFDEAGLLSAVSRLLGRTAVTKPVRPIVIVGSALDQPAPPMGNLPVAGLR
jgi:two-component system chemotaxis sensor kinase CheA